MISILVNDFEYSEIINASVSRSLDNLTGNFQFALVNQKKTDNPIRVQDKCKIFVDGNLVLTGFIDSLSIRYSQRGDSIRFSGRGKLQDLIDSSVGTEIDLKGQISLVDVCKITLNSLNMVDVEVIDLVGDIELFTDAEIVSGDVIESAFSFLEKFARQRQVFLIENEEGNLTITRTSRTQVDYALFNTLEGGNSNNIKSAVKSIDFRDRFNKYFIHGQLNTSAIDFDLFDLADDEDIEELIKKSKKMGFRIPFVKKPRQTEEEEDAAFEAFAKSFSSSVSTQIGEAIDEDVRVSRAKHLQSEESVEAGIAGDRAVWESNIRRARSVKYTATIFGSKKNETELWNPNILVTISDDLAGVYANMLLWKVTFSQSVASGSETVLEFVPPDALDLIETEPIPQKKSNTIDIDWSQFADELEEAENE